MNPYVDLSIWNFILLPILLGLVYAYAFSYRDKLYGRTHPWRPYFIPALSVKIFGAIFIGLVYAYYYKGGDTFNYFYHSQVINSALDESFSKWLNLVLRIPSPTDGEYYEYISKMEWYRDPSTYTVASLTAILSLFTFNNYLLTAVLFAIISFSGIWALFRTFSDLYPKQQRAIAISILFIPSIFVWGSGIFKDSLCMLGLGWLTFSCFAFLLKRNYSALNIAIAAFAFILVGVIKIYILMAFAPALAVWLLFNYTKKIKNPLAKTAFKVIFISSISVLTLLVFQSFSQSLGKYSLDKISQTANVTRQWISYMSEKDEGAAYSIGEFTPNLLGMLSKFPEAVNVTLFRPYIWEARKPIVFLSALESLLFLYITLKLLLGVGLKNVLNTIRTDPTIQFCLVFSIIFSFAVGISTYNFGALSRYKIPALSFYLMAITLIWYKNKPAKKKLIPFLKF